MNTTIFLTSMRHPIDRILSMYWFEGRWPRICAKACEEKRLKDDTTKVADLEEWMEHVHDQTNYSKLKYTRHNQCGQWISVENYYIRQFLGMDRASNDKNELYATKYGRGFKNITVTRDHLHQAKEILASFDLVLIQEQMMDPNYKAAVDVFYEMIGYPPDKIPTTLANARKGYERQKYETPPSQAALQRLQEWNALDIELYDYAVELSAKMVKEWNIAKTTMSSNLNVTKDCHKPPFRLPTPVFDIALGGLGCCPGPNCRNEQERKFFYFHSPEKHPGCMLHSTEGKK